MKPFSLTLNLLFFSQLFCAQQYHIEFKPVQDTDLALIHAWLHKSWVKQWFVHEAVSWQEFLQFRKQIQNYFDTGGEFLACHHDHPFGYIRYYDAHVWVDGLGDVDPEGTYGIDLYIGEENLLGKGYGSAMLYQFMQKIIEDQKIVGKPITQIVVDPDIRNVAAINLYVKLGFVIDREVDDPYWGKQYIMAIDPMLIR